LRFDDDKNQKSQEMFCTFEIWFDFPAQAEACKPIPQYTKLLQLDV